MLRPWGWYLQIAGTNKMNDVKKHNVLHHDADVCQLLKNKVEGKACNNLLKVRVAGDEDNEPRWLDHPQTMLCSSSVSS